MLACLGTALLELPPRVIQNACKMDCMKFEVLTCWYSCGLWARASAMAAFDGRSKFQKI